MTEAIDLTDWTTEERNLAPAMVHAHYWENGQHLIHGVVSADHSTLELDAPMPDGAEIPSEELRAAVQAHIASLEQAEEE